MFEFLKKKPKLKVKVMVQSAMPDEFSPDQRASIYNLGVQDGGLITGMMGGCCSVILLWGRSIDGKTYLNVRGQHGSGGPGALDWAQLVTGFTADTSSVIYVAAAAGDLNAYFVTVKAEITRRAIRSKLIKQPGSCSIIFKNGYAAPITTTEYSDRSKYEITY